ncbi:hypothetical protein K2173_006395 [Erythroxylum novogranatense]|uniref:Uncharacterized protein n=1 Tax=Erythroxylum novogranatense TaxID=1862640 RepID=A0AAV8U726_9ROSI|nr:hypothetical protein K2173_006395 [Erythroxylum novogranatense]
MELLKFSKFRLQLQALISEIHDLRERERSATEQCGLLVQKQRKMEEEYGSRVHELEADLASCNEQREKLERKVNYLHNDNALLENKLKELKGTIQNLLQSRESFVNVYEESTGEMKCAIEMKDRKLDILSEKINSHFCLFDSIEKEAFSIKQVVDSVRCLVSEKEEVVTILQGKMDKVCSFESLFVEKILQLEQRVACKDAELHRKEKVIAELKAALEAEKLGNMCQNHVEEISIQNTLLAKDAVIHNLISEKEALNIEVGTLATILQRIKDTIRNMNQEDSRVLSSVLECREDGDTVMAAEDNRVESLILNFGDMPPNEASSLVTAENKGEDDDLANH